MTIAIANNKAIDFFISYMLNPLSILLTINPSSFSFPVPPAGMQHENDRKMEKVNPA
ncbi:MAG: hypothetical protein LJE94_18160 [Deltaproteobacteria bacterium]|nr:hypothetical protein [Deltaproteobacteria bacterium]